MFPSLAKYFPCLFPPARRIVNSSCEAEALNAGNWTSPPGFPAIITASPSVWPVSLSATWSTSSVRRLLAQPHRHSYLLALVSPTGSCLSDSLAENLVSKQ